MYLTLSDIVYFSSVKFYQTMEYYYDILARASQSWRSSQDSWQILLRGFMGSFVILRTTVTFPRDAML